MEKDKLDLLSINTLRFLAADAVENSQSGHPGTAMGAAPTAFVLWNEFLKHTSSDPDWVDRDRFVLSAGHASMLLYGLLHLFDYPLTIEDLKQFRQLDSKTPGHPEVGHVVGVETTTGPLGQGLTNAVGMALAEAHLAARYNRLDTPKIVDHYTYVLASDGDLMEGVSAEAASLAGHLGLGKLIVLYDDNEVTIDGPTSLTFGEDVLKRFEAYGWHTQRVGDVLQLDDIREAIRMAKEEKEKPSIIAIKSIIGYSAPLVQGTSKAHHSPLGPDQLRDAKESQNWPGTEMFHVPQEVYQHVQSAIETGAARAAAWQKDFEEYTQKYPEEAAEFLQGFDPAGSLETFKVEARFQPVEGAKPTRVVNGPVVNEISAKIPALVGGCADLAMATATTILDSPAIARGEFAGRNIHFGVREHAMGSITNGIFLHGGLRPFTATFLVFSDYMRPSIRMAALMNLPILFVFTHDSIGLGEDGPTHQPVEQMMSLRLIPNLTLIRPADANEVAQAWEAAIKNLEGPTTILLTRQPLPILDPETQVRDGMVAKGAYILSEASGESPELILIASGSEVHVALEAQGVLEGDGIPTRVVSMPSWELFASQPMEYQEIVLPPEIKTRMSIEAGATAGWERWVGEFGYVFGIDRFGKSAPAQALMEDYGFTAENIARLAKENLFAAEGVGR